MQVFISGFANMYSNLMTNSNWRHNADPNKANNGTDNGRAKRAAHLHKKGKAIQIPTYFTLNAFLMFLRVVAKFQVAPTLTSSFCNSSKTSFKYGRNTSPNLNF